LALAAILKAHANLRPTNLKDRATDSASREQNAIELTNTMKTRKLPFCSCVIEIVSSTVCMLCVMTSYLMEVLSRYLPVSVIEFATTCTSR
jgi:hypothetical protein